MFDDVRFAQDGVVGSDAAAVYLEVAKKPPFIGDGCETVCAACGRRGIDLLMCPCEAVFYCNIACQAQHWKTHAKVCQHGRRSAIPVTACAGCGKVSDSNAWCVCGKVLYCSSACQLRHWEEAHHAECDAQRSGLRRRKELAAKLFGSSPSTNEAVENGA